MLSRFDDYPIHQTPEPVAHPGTSDREFYERYWFNGYSEAGDMYFAIGMGLYPHLGVRDFAISIVCDGEQHSFHASGRAGREPTDQRVGPARLEIDEPMRSCRVIVDDNETGIACDLRFAGRTACIEEPRHKIFMGQRALMDTTRFAQLGRWSGTIRFAGRELRIEPQSVLGTKDRSWGVRPVGGRDLRGAPPDPGAFQIYFLWAPLHWEDCCTHFQLFEDRHGRPLYQVGAILPVYDTLDAIPGVEDPDVVHMRALEHELSYCPGTRRAEHARLGLIPVDGGDKHVIELEPTLIFRMKGIGYAHPEWPHGKWQGELRLAAERWKCDEVDPHALENQHIQQVVRARMGERTGIGVLEQNCFGPHAPSGWKSLLDAD